MLYIGRLQHHQPIRQPLTLRYVGVRALTGNSCHSSAAKSVRTILVKRPSASAACHSHAEILLHFVDVTEYSIVAQDMYHNFRSQNVQPQNAP